MAISNILDIKAGARRIVHDILAAPSTYTDDVVADLPVTVTHRDKNAEVGDLEGDYAQVLTGIDRLKFLNPPAGLKRKGRVTIPGEGIFELDQIEPSIAPDVVYWQVIRRAA